MSATTLPISCSITGPLPTLLPSRPQKTERRERSKSKKIYRGEAAIKLDSTASATSTSSPSPTDTVIPVVRTESASSSSESDASSGGIEADTEESMTSEEEPDKPAAAKLDTKDPTKDKWVAVRGQQGSSLET